MLVTDLINVRYLTGFGGTNGACVCGEEARLFLTDFRYTERAEAEVEGWEVVTVASDWLGGLAERLAGRVGFEDDHVSVRTAGAPARETRRGRRAGGRRGDGREAAPGQGRGRAGGDRSRRGAGRRGLALGLERGLVGRSEREVALAAEARIRELGAEPSFPAIVAAGAQRRPAARRAAASGRSAAASWSSSTWGQSSTATAPTAPAPSPPASRASAAREVYELVLAAQAAALEALAAGAEGEAVDAVARELIEAAGHGERFGHGLGHGVGLEVHEAPRLSQRSEDTLAAPAKSSRSSPGSICRASSG